MPTDELTERTITANGIELHVTEAGTGPAVLLCHGFPELGYSWRHQIPALAAAGHHVIAPDLRGFGRSSCPEPIGAYSVDHVAADLHGILDHIGVERAVFVGHDWGAQIVWNMAVLCPQRMSAVVGMSVPFTPRSSVPPTEMMREKFGEGFYILQFQPPGVVDALMNANPDMMIRNAVVATGADWATPEDIERYAADYTRTGFTGGLNYYRNFDRNWELMTQCAGQKVEMPAAFITGSEDPLRSFAPGDEMEDWIPDLRVNATIDGAGHCVQQERPDEVNRLLLEFLAGLDRDGEVWA